MSRARPCRNGLCNAGAAADSTRPHSPTPTSEFTAASSGRDTAIFCRSSTPYCPAGDIRAHNYASLGIRAVAASRCAPSDTFVPNVRGVATGQGNARIRQHSHPTSHPWRAKPLEQPLRQGQCRAPISAPCRAGLGLASGRTAGPLYSCLHI